MINININDNYNHDSNYNNNNNNNYSTKQHSTQTDLKGKKTQKISYKQMQKRIEKINVPINTKGTKKDE